MSKFSIDFRGRSRKLKICYRTSDEIRMWAVAVMSGVTVDDLDESTDDLRGYRSLFHGPTPDVVLAGSSDQQLSSLIEWIEKCKNERLEEEDICVLAARNDLVKAEREGL